MRYWFGILACILLTLCGQAWAQGTVVAPAIGNYAPCYSPDGKWIAYLRGTDAQHCDELWVMDAEGKNARVLLTQDARTFTGIWSGSLDIRSDLRPELRQVIAARMQYLALKHPLVQTITWLPDSQSLLCRVTDAPLSQFFYKLSLDRQIVTLPVNYQITQVKAINDKAVISPDGKTLALISDGPHLQLIAMNTGEVVSEKSFEGTGYTCHEASWGTDGRIYCALTPIMQLEYVPSGIYALTPDGPLTPVVTLGGERSPALSPDGKWLAYLREQTLVTREQATGKETPVVHGVTGYRWLPSGRLLATTYDVTIEKSTILTNVAPCVPSNMREEILVFNPSSEIPELRVHYRTTDVLLPMYLRSSGRVTLDLMQTPNVAGISKFPTFLNTLPDISPDGKRLVYAWEGALYLMDVSTEQIHSISIKLPA